MVSAARWFQSVESHLKSSYWPSLCRLLHDRFDHDQKELLIRQLFNIRQTASVSEYVTRFTELVDHLAAYSINTDPMYFAMRFIDGLRPDIKSMVLVLHPHNLDTACIVALLQEEAIGQLAFSNLSILAMVIGLLHHGFLFRPPSQRYHYLLHRGLIVHLQP